MGAEACRARRVGATSGVVLVPNVSARARAVFTSTFLGTGNARAMGTTRAMGVGVGVVAIFWKFKSVYVQ